jgi:hypothetical protein
MGLDFIVEHELQRCTCDLVLIDDKDAPLIYGLGSFDTNLHYALVRWLKFDRPQQVEMGAASGFKQVLFRNLSALSRTPMFSQAEKP